MSILGRRPVPVGGNHFDGTISDNSAGVKMLKEITDISRIAVIIIIYKQI